MHKLVRHLSGPKRWRCAENRRFIKHQWNPWFLWLSTICQVPAVCLSEKKSQGQDVLQNAARSLSHRSTRSPNHPMSPERTFVDWCGVHGSFFSNSFPILSSFVKLFVKSSIHTYSRKNICKHWWNLVQNSVENTCLKEFHLCLRPPENMESIRAWSLTLVRTFDQNNSRDASAAVVHPIRISF